jgi:His-Xaa-Ser system protein HxsD
MEIMLTFDNRINSIESVQKALYRLGSGFDFDIKLIGSSIELRVSFLDLETDSQLIATEVKRSVNDYSLREKIGAETADLRNLI